MAHADNLPEPLVFGMPILWAFAQRVKRLAKRVTRCYTANCDADAAHILHSAFRILHSAGPRSSIG
jgi:hypothetical protein